MSEREHATPVARQDAAARPWTPSGLPMDPAVRQALKADAALAGISMHRRLHMILVAHLRGRGLLDAGPETAA